MNRDDRAEAFRRASGQRSPERAGKDKDSSKKTYRQNTSKMEEYGIDDREEYAGDYGTDRAAARRDRERRRQELRRRQIRVRFLTFLAVVVLLIGGIVLAVTLTGRNRNVPGSASASGESQPETPGTKEETKDKETPGESESASEGISEEQTDAPGSTVKSTEYLRQLQTRIPDYVTQDFIPVNEYSRPCIALGEVNNIVIHYVGNPGSTAAGNLGYFKCLADPNVNTTGHKASSNFIVGLEGEILQCMPIYEMAYCSNNRNSDTLSIEVCHPDEGGKFNDTTYASLIRFCAWLCRELDLTEQDLIRHYDVTGKHCPKYYVEVPEAWDQLKKDVGAALAAN